MYVKMIPCEGMLNAVSLLISYCTRRKSCIDATEDEIYMCVCSNHKYTSTEDVSHPLTVILLHKLTLLREFEIV